MLMGKGLALERIYHDVRKIIVNCSALPEAPSPYGASPLSFFQTAASHCASGSNTIGN